MCCVKKQSRPTLKIESGPRVKGVVNYPRIHFWLKSAVCCPDIMIESYSPTYWLWGNWSVNGSLCVPGSNTVSCPTIWITIKYILSENIH